MSRRILAIATMTLALIAGSNPALAHHQSERGCTGDAGAPYRHVYNPNDDLDYFQTWGEMSCDRTWDVMAIWLDIQRWEEGIGWKSWLEDAATREDASTFRFYHTHPCDVGGVYRTIMDGSAVVGFINAKVFHYSPTGYIEFCSMLDTLLWGG